MEILKEDDHRKENYDVQGNVSFSEIVKALEETGRLFRGEKVIAVYPTERGIGYYAVLDMEK